MKRLLSKMIVVGSVCFLTSTLSFADAAATPTAATDTPTAKSWICKTNASHAASGSAAETADKEMTKAKPASAAFEFAYSNCRDCTKITCKSQ